MTGLLSENHAHLINDSVPSTAAVNTDQHTTPIIALSTKLRQTGSVLESERSGRPSIANAHQANISLSRFLKILLNRQFRKRPLIRKNFKNLRKKLQHLTRLLRPGGNFSNFIFYFFSAVEIVKRLYNHPVCAVVLVPYCVSGIRSTPEECFLYALGCFL